MLNQARVRRQADELMSPKAKTDDDEQAVENTAYFQTRQRILSMLSALTDQESKLLTLRFGLEGGLPATPQETASKLGITADEVIKLETEALAKLRDQV